MAKRIEITDAMREQVHPFTECDACGDDVQVHEWIEVRESDGKIVDCDRRLGYATDCETCRNGGSHV